MRPLPFLLTLCALFLLSLAPMAVDSAQAAMTIRNFDTVDRKVTVISVGNVEREVIVPARGTIRLFEPYVQFVDETGSRLHGYDPFEFVILNGALRINRYNDRGH